MKQPEWHFRHYLPRPLPGSVFVVILSLDASPASIGTTPTRSSPCLNALVLLFCLQSMLFLNRREPEIGNQIGDVRLEAYPTIHGSAPDFFAFPVVDSLHSIPSPHLFPYPYPRDAGFADLAVRFPHPSGLQKLALLVDGAPVLARSASSISKD